MRQLNFLPSIGWAIILLFLLLSPRSQLPQTTINGLDIIVHFLLYSIFSFLLIRDQKAFYNILESKTLWTGIFISVFYGTILEVIQPLVADRTTEFSDFLANFTGAVTGGVITMKFIKSRHDD